jgi:hypothetical protein
MGVGGQRHAPANLTPRTRASGQVWTGTDKRNSHAPIGVRTFERPAHCVGATPTRLPETQSLHVEILDLAQSKLYLFICILYIQNNCQMARITEPQGKQFIRFAGSYPKSAAHPHKAPL